MYWPSKRTNTQESEQAPNNLCLEHGADLPTPRLKIIYYQNAD